MGTRYEWVSARYAHVKYVPDRHDVSTGEPSDSNSEYDVTEGGAVVFSGDDAVVLHGTPEELRTLLRLALRRIDEGEAGRA